MAKAKEFYEGYINFYRNNGRWSASLTDEPYVPPTDQWKILIPIPEQLCSEEFPEKVIVRRVEVVAA